MRIVVFSLIALACTQVTLSRAQESASFRLNEHVLNLGGHPDRSGTAGSASYRVSLDSLGETLVRTGLSSTSFRMDAAFGSAYPPPGEVDALGFLDASTLVWSAERSVGSYNVYRGALTAVAAQGYGDCWQQGLVGQTATDTDPVPAGGGFFYLVTASNRLREEGGKGRDSDDAGRRGNTCP